MLKHYFIIGWRNMMRMKDFSIINVSGLAMGMAAAILIGLWVFDEIWYNKSFKNYDRLGQVYHHLNFGGEILTINDVPAPIGRELKDTYAEIEEIAMTTMPRTYFSHYGETTVSSICLFVEPTFIKLFSVQLIEGTQKSLKDIHAVLVSRSLAAILVGEDPVGKMIEFDNRTHMTIAGVFEDFPANSAFAEVKMLLPLEYHFTRDAFTRKLENNWEEYYFQCFVLMKDGASFVGLY